MRSRLSDGTYEICPELRKIFSLFGEFSVKQNLRTYLRNLGSACNTQNRLYQEQCTTNNTNALNQLLSTLAPDRTFLHDVA
jgi:hypothetical protein